MGQRKMLNERERAQIEVLARSNPDWTYKQIAIQVQRSPQFEAKYLKSPETYGTLKSSGRPKVTTPRQDREIFRRAANRKMRADQIRRDLKLDCSVHTVQQRLSSNPKFRYGKHRAKPKLTQSHKMQRLEFAKRHVSFTPEQWAQIDWSDEKKFNLDGPDALHCFWYDLRKEKGIFSKRNFDEGSIMIWAALGHYSPSILQTENELRGIY